MAVVRYNREIMDNQLSIAEAFEIAFSCHANGDLAQAETIYRLIQDASPEEPQSLHYLGILLHQREGSDLALQYVQRSVEIAPDNADWRNDLGNILAQRGELAAAVLEFERAVALRPKDPLLWTNLGAVLQRMNKTADAQSAFRKAIEIDPCCAAALSNLANSLESCGCDLEAAHYHCRAYVLEPTADKPKSLLGIAYYNLGRYAEAAEVYRQWMEEEPENPTPRHLYAACSGRAVPLRASDSYVEKTFDDFAANFDSRLQGLSYRGPQLVAAALEKMAAPGANRAVLDAGCGTGLCAEYLAPYARELTGVDLSAAMLLQAQKRGLYHRLEKCELTAYLRSHPGAFDLIAAADTLIYFGALDELFAAVFSALNPQGLFVFTVESAPEDEDFQLNPHGRYSHGKNPLLASLRQAGFELLSLDSGVIRVEFGSEVKSLVVSARRNP